MPPNLQHPLTVLEDAGLLVRGPDPLHPAADVVIVDPDRLYNAD